MYIKQNLPNRKTVGIFIQKVKVGMPNIAWNDPWTKIYKCPIEWSSAMCTENISETQLSNEKNPGCLVYIGD